MNYNFTLLILCLSFIVFHSQKAQAQVPADCEGGRYTTETSYYFPIDSVDVQFAKNVDAAGDTIDLEMTIFYPTGDVVEKRPVVILAFGGAFVTGERSSMAPTCRLLAMQGIVAITVDYRIYPVFKLGYPSITQFYDTAIKAYGDIKSAVRHVRRMIDHGNPYKMDGDRIMIGGVSAGAVASLHAACLNENDNLDPLIDSLIIANGGFSGNSGDDINLSYSSDVVGVINLSGALLDTTYLDEEDDFAIVSMHGTADATVPFAYGKALGLIPVYGSSLVHARALHENLPSRLTVVEGGGHTDIYSAPEYEDDRIAFFHQLDTTIMEVFCGVVLDVQDAIFSEISVYPNPATNFISWERDFDAGNLLVGVYNQLGQLVIERQINSSEHQLDISELNEGLYYMFISPVNQNGKNVMFRTKFMKGW